MQPYSHPGYLLPCGLAADRTTLPDHTPRCPIEIPQPHSKSKEKDFRLLPLSLGIYLS